MKGRVTSPNTYLIRAAENKTNNNKWKEIIKNTRIIKNNKWKTCRNNEIYQFTQSRSPVNPKQLRNLH